MCGGLKSSLAVAASQVSERASLLEPSVYRHLDITVDVPAQDRKFFIRNRSLCSHSNRWGLEHHSESVTALCISCSGLNLFKQCKT